MPVAGKVEGDGLGLPRFLPAQRPVDDHADRVRRLGRRQLATGARERYRGLERRPLVYRYCLDQLLLVERAHRRRHLVVAQTAWTGAGMNEWPSVCIFTSGVIIASSPKSCRYCPS